jgi:pimeloyl-ACP methyl ester carboxylesterase
MVDLKKNGKSVSVEPTLVRISDKLSLRYEMSGNGPPLVVLHTIYTQLEYFRALAPLLAEKFTVYAVDLPGHGRSPIDRLEHRALS